MTCIVGYADGKRVWMGGDSAGADGSWNLTVRADHKVFRNGEFLFGFTSSFRMGQLLRYKFEPPLRRPETDLERYMVAEFIEGVRSCLKQGGYTQTKESREEGGEFLVGHAGRLFKICGDFQLEISTHPFAACGCGEPYALGALFDSPYEDPAQKVAHALRAAEQFSAGVRGPFHLEMLGDADAG